MIETTTPITWPRTRTGKLIFKSTDQALIAGRGYFNNPGFIHYLEKEIVRLQGIFNNISKSIRMNLDNTCKLATRLQFNRECLNEALKARRYWEIQRQKEDFVNDGSA